MGKKKEADEYIWRVSSTNDEGIVLNFGTELSEAPYSDEDKLHILGRALINLGTRLMGSTTTDDDDWDED